MLSELFESHEWLCAFSVWDVLWLCEILCICVIAPVPMKRKAKVRMCVANFANFVFMCVYLLYVGYCEMFALIIKKR